MNRERRKEVARVFFDLSKYLLTTVAVGSFITENFDFGVTSIAVIASFSILVIAYYITPTDKL